MNHLSSGRASTGRAEQKHAQPPDWARPQLVSYSQAPNQTTPKPAITPNPHTPHPPPPERPTSPDPQPDPSPDPRPQEYEKKVPARRRLGRGGTRFGLCRAVRLCCRGSSLCAVVSDPSMNFACVSLRCQPPKSKSNPKTKPTSPHPPPPETTKPKTKPADKQHPCPPSPTLRPRKRHSKNRSLLFSDPLRSISSLHYGLVVATAKAFGL